MAQAVPPLSVPVPACPAPTLRALRATEAVPLEQARRDRGLTVAALAAGANVSEATIYRITRGATAPRPHVVRRLSAALGRTPEEIAEFRRGGAELALRGDARSRRSGSAG